MLPGEVLGGLNFVPAEIGFGFLVGALDEKALTLASGQNGQRRISGSVAEAIVAFAVLVSAHHQPFFAGMEGFVLILPGRPDAAGGKVGGQLTALSGTHGQGLPVSL